MPLNYADWSDKDKQEFKKKITQINEALEDNKNIINDFIADLYDLLQKSFTTKELLHLFYNLGTILGHEIPFTCKKCKEQTNRINDEGLCFVCGTTQIIDEIWKIKDIKVKNTFKDAFVPFSKNYQSNDVQFIPTIDPNSVHFKVIKKDELPTKDSIFQFLGAVKGIANDFLNKKDTTSKQAIFRIIKQLNNYFPDWREKE